MLMPYALHTRNVYSMRGPLSSHRCAVFLFNLPSTTTLYRVHPIYHNIPAVTPSGASRTVAYGGDSHTKARPLEQTMTGTVRARFRYKVQVQIQVPGPASGNPSIFILCRSCSCRDLRHGHSRPRSTGTMPIINQYYDRFFRVNACARFPRSVAYNMKPSRS